MSKASEKTTKSTPAAPVEQYIAAQPKAVQPLLRRMRKIVRAAAPSAEERMAYGMPCYYQNGPVAYFAAAKTHIGFYPTPEGIEAFAKELAPYSQSKGTVRFPLDQPLPEDLIARMVKHRVEENAKNLKQKK